MCGIAGFLKKNIRIKNNSIYEMMDIQAHRGPDDAGTCGIEWANDGTAVLLPEMRGNYGCIGFNRLSIQDLSSAGHQPMLDREKRVAIAFNGEIYNTDMLKRRYLADTSFRGNSDTEVILCLYLKLGIEKTARLLNGMFAIVILDADRQECYFVRDRAGIKPLYLYHDADKIVFASEIKSILASGLIRPELNYAAAYEILLFGFLYRRTLVKGISEIMPGSVTTADMKSFSVKKELYWNIEDELSQKTGGVNLKAILRKAVHRQLVSDVPVGAQLSGGIDSSLITYFSAGKSDDAVCKAVGIIPDSESLSEEKWMDAAAKKAGVQLYKKVLDSSWTAENWRKAVWHLDGIPGFGNELGIFLLAGGAKQSGLTVLLSGEGADELFAGYFNLAWGEALIRAAQISRKIPFLEKTLYERIRQKFSWGGAESERIEDAYLLYNGGAVHRESLEQVCQDSFCKYRREALKIRKKKIHKLNGIVPLFDRIRAYEILVRLLALLNRQDKMTMALSVENRVPMLDNDMISAALRMGRRNLVKICLKSYADGGLGEKVCGKYPLKKMASGIFGQEFAFRKKCGFSVDFQSYIRTYMESLDYQKTADTMEKRGIINMRVFEEMMKNVGSYSNGSEETALLWRIISLEIFCQDFIDRKWQQKS